MLLKQYTPHRVAPVTPTRLSLVDPDLSSLVAVSFSFAIAREVAGCVCDGGRCSEEG